MNTNPHVDRVLLDERVGEIQWQAPIPGIEFDISAVDQCAPNAITDIGTGYVLRLDIDNFSNVPLQNSSDRQGWQGFGLNSVSYYSKIGGAITGLSYWACKITGISSTTVHSAGQWVYFVHSVDFSSIKRDVFDHIVRGNYFVRMPVLFQTNVSLTDLSTQGRIWGQDVGIHINMWSNSPNTQLMVYRKATSALGVNINTAGTFSVGAAIMETPWFRPVVGPNNVVPQNMIGSGFYAPAGYSGKQGEGIPVGIRSLFPPSWHHS